MITELAACNADIITLQEVDIGCDRSGGEDTGKPNSIGGNQGPCINLYNAPRQLKLMNTVCGENKPCVWS